MALTIGSNIASLTAQRRLAEGTSQLSKTFERLSSGQRINKAADDAAGLAISESLKSDRRVFNQGVRNFNDGISLLNIADGAIENLSNITIRLKELAEQSANGTYSTTQRAAIDKEAQALSKEYTRIVHSTKFNGVHLLDGSLGNGVRLQGGFGAEGSIFSGIGGAIGTGQIGNLVTTSSNLGTIKDMQIGDLNGDGYLDAITAGNYIGNRGLSIFLGSSSGSLTLFREYSLGVNSSESIGLGDLNNDGILDIVVADGTANILIGTGKGDFSAAGTITVPTGTNDLKLKDINSDGNVDLIAAGIGVTVRLGTGTGTFGSAVTYAMESGQSEAVDIADFNNDGIMDLVTGGGGGGTGRTTIRLGLGNGTFGNSTSYQTDSTFTNDIAVGDVNGDGNLDLVSAGTDAANGTARVQIGNGNGTFQTAISYVLNAGTTRNVELNDLNGDGILDLIGAGNDTGIVGVSSISLGRGDGTFQNAVTYSQYGAQMYDVKAGDYNGDGVLDVIAAGYGTSGHGALNLRYGIAEAGTSPLLPFDLSTLADARQALPVFDQKIQQLAKQRGQIGAFQSRVQVGINNLQTASENYAAAESRIRDVDVADESSKLTRLNILQQAASSILGQANLQPQLALRLLNK